ncbi:MAG: AMP-binding protein, partial [Sphingomonadaceae bacterium]|nr:AMP-binding protein [Sphingomonadaceae bacterium]
KIVDDAGAPLGAGEAGELLVSGDGVMRGYFEDAAATARTIDADGWLHTGDIAVADAAGNIRITDRRDDVFIVGGFNAYPAEIEGLLAAHPAILQSAVVGIPDARMGSVARAFIVLRPGHRLDEAELVGWCRANMANYKVPRQISFVEALPQNASGKVQKFLLRADAT